MRWNVIKLRVRMGKNNCSQSGLLRFVSKEPVILFWLKSKRVDRCLTNGSVSHRSPRADQEACADVFDSYSSDAAAIEPVSPGSAARPRVRWPRPRWRESPPVCFHPPHSSADAPTGWSTPTQAWKTAESACAEQFEGCGLWWHILKKKLLVP